MALKALKCPQCGANLELDDNREFGFCEYCGAKVQIREVIEVRHKIDNSEQLSNYKMLGERAFGVKNYSEALDYYSKAIEFDPNDSVCLYRRAFCKVYTKQIKDINISEFSNEINRALKNATQEDINQIEKELVFWYEKLFRDLGVEQNLFTTPSFCELQIFKIITFLSFSKVIISLLKNDKDKENLLLKTIDLCDKKTYLKLKYGEIGSGQYTIYKTSPQNISSIEKYRKDFSEIYNNMPVRANELKKAQEYCERVSLELSEIDTKIIELKKNKDITVKNPQRQSFSVIRELIAYIILIVANGAFWAYVSKYIEMTYEDGTPAGLSGKLFFWFFFFISGAIIFAIIMLCIALKRRSGFYINKQLIEEKCNADKIYNQKILYYKKKKEKDEADRDLAIIKRKLK